MELQTKRTNLDSLWPDIKHSDHASDEGAAGLEVQTADTPRALHQEDDVSLGRGLAFGACEVGRH